MPPPMEGRPTEEGDSFDVVLGRIGAGGFTPIRDTDGIPSFPIHEMSESQITNFKRGLRLVQEKTARECKPAPGVDTHEVDIDP